MSPKIQAFTEIAQFFVQQPTPEQIIAFHPSPEVAGRTYELIYAEREGPLSKEESEELDSYMVIEQLMQIIKLEANRKLNSNYKRRPHE